MIFTKMRRTRLARRNVEKAFATGDWIDKLAALERLSRALRGRR